MDNLFESVGPFGRYQKCTLALLGFISSLTAMSIYSTIFTAATPSLECFYKNTTNKINDTFICEVWSNITQNLKNNASNDVYECKFDKRYYGVTMANEYGFICDKQFLIGLTQTIFMIGTVSALFIGVFSDKYGRKRVLLVLSILLSIVLMASEFVQLNMLNFSITTKYIIYCIGQFFVGLLTKSLYLVAYILLIEITTQKYTTIVSNINLYMYVLGELFVLVIAYFFRDWHVLTWTLAGYSLVSIFVILFFIPESPRFLLTKNRKSEAFDLFKKISKFNKSNINADEIESSINKLLDASEKNNESGISAESNGNGNGTVELVDAPKVITTNFSFLYKPLKNFFHTIIFIYIWFSASLLYYGVSLGITNLDQDINPYLTYLISSIAEVIGYASCHLNDIFGRKRMFILYLMSASVVCLAVALIPSSSSIQTDTLTVSSILKIFFASVGKAMASGAFNSCYIYNSLSYPTIIRSTAVLFSSNVGSIGSFISPQINLLGTLLWKPLPYFIFSGSAFIAAGLVFLLPDPNKVQFN